MFSRIDSKAETQVWRNIRLLQRHAWRVALIRLVRLGTGNDDGDGMTYSFPKIKSQYLRRLEREYLKGAACLRKGFPKPSQDEYVERLGAMRREMEQSEKEILDSCETFSTLIQVLIPEETIGGFDDVTRRINRLFMLLVRLCDTQDDMDSARRQRRVVRRVEKLRDRLEDEYSRLIPRFRELKQVSYMDAKAKLAYLSGEEGDLRFSVKTRQEIRRARRNRPMPDGLGD